MVASAIATAPWLADLSRHKAWVFSLAGVMLAADYWILYRSASVACRPGGTCHRSHPFGRWMRRAFWFSVGLLTVALTAAYLLLPVARLFGY